MEPPYPWGTVCDDDWGDEDLEVACKAVGLPPVHTLRPVVRGPRDWGVLVVGAALHGGGGRPAQPHPHLKVLGAERQKADCTSSTRRIIVEPHDTRCTTN